MTKSKLVAIVIVVMVVSVVLYYINSTRNSITAPVPRSVAKEIDTSKWETYRDEKIGYEIKYPKELVGIENISTSTEVKVFSLDNYVGVPIVLQKEGGEKGNISLVISVLVEKADNPNNLPVDQWITLNMESVVKHYLSTRVPMATDKKYTTIQGESAFHLERADGGYGNGLYAFTDSVTFVMHNGYYYSISYTTPPANPTLEWKSHPYYKYLEQSVPITEAIINSFKFTK